jgi:hypothetical protein
MARSESESKIPLFDRYLGINDPGGGGADIASEWPRSYLWMRLADHDGLSPTFSTHPWTPLLAR